jgi:hypothetical protein
MQHLTITIERVLHVQRNAPSGLEGRHTVFSFVSEGQYFQDIAVPGWPRVEDGTRVVALLRERGNWNSLVGWVDTDTGDVVAPDPTSALLRAGAALAIFLLLVLVVWSAHGPFLPLEGLLLLALSVLLQTYLLRNFALCRRQFTEARNIFEYKARLEG